MSLIGAAGGVFLGLVIGVISELVGIGGGAFLIPAVMAFYGISQLRAQGTSVATLLLPIGALAFWRYYEAGHVDLYMAALIATRFFLGDWWGGFLAEHLPPLSLKRTFAILMAVLAIKLG